KYLLFAFTACLLGGVLGDIFGFIFMPRFVSVILKELYNLPQYYLRFDNLYGVGGILLFMAAIVGATMLACRSELTQMPAALLRPKAPRSGARVWLERIPGIWNRLKFLNKVTIRNLFRYKKRMFMTIGGIMGCTALIICGFAIKDSVMALAPSQYDNIYQYDLMTVFKEKDNDNLVRQLAKDSNIDDYMNLRIENVKLLNTGGTSSSVQLMVIPNGSTIEDYIRIEDLDGTPIHLKDAGIFITQNATRILGLKTGDTVFVQNMALEQHEAAVSGIVRNYLGNNVYMTQKLYESLFGKYVPNGILAHLSDTCSDQAAYAQILLDNDSVLSSVSIAALREDFGFDLINAVVLLLIVMAGGLALVVLFTLSNTNISERVRELATIKVLGFYDNEVYQYVNKETLILTAVGILIGLPVGRGISGLLTTVLNMPSIHFAVHVEPVSYLFSAVITFFFAIIVNWITNRTLNHINMVEALKSVE
ncbi:ABC transporter permease, partial [Anaerocolumna sp.]|uniref:ABC transporter permease n=1 Tax=Anaerocolumna sp. TaxID=2041569 RepID=UPI0028A72311